jgi:hypothetical protein
VRKCEQKRRIEKRRKKKKKEVSLKRNRMSGIVMYARTYVPSINRTGQEAVYVL